MTRRGSADPEAAGRRATKARVAHGVWCVMVATAITVVLFSLAAGGVDADDAGAAARLAVVQVVAALVGAGLAAINARELRAADDAARRAVRRWARTAFGIAVALLAVVGGVVGAAGEASVSALALLAAVVPAYEVLLAGATAHRIPADGR